MKYMWLPQTMLSVVQSGGNLTIDMEQQILLPATMEQLAVAAANSNVVVTFKNCKSQFILPQTMVRVSQLGRGHVTFEQ